MTALRPHLHPFWLCALLAWSAQALATEVNTASEADLDSMRGLGPGLTARILAQRQLRPFESWADLVDRVPGLGQTSARRLSAHGLTVNGRSLPERATGQPATGSP
jgi:competence protein ComEA